MRTPAHFQREIGKEVTVRLRNPQADPRRLQGVLAAADDSGATLLLDDGEERRVEIAEIDKARTVFEWGPAPKPGKGPSNKSGAKKSAPKTKNPTSTKEKQAS